MRSFSPDQPRAIVVGLDTMQGLQAARILARQGVPVIAIASDGRHHACRTNVCEKVVVAESRDELMAVLGEIGRTQQTKGVLIPCLDGKVLTISRAREELSEWFHIVLPPADVVEMLMDKSAFYRFAGERGFPIPSTQILGPGDDIDPILGEVEYPAAVKPAYRTSVWTSHTTEKAFRVDSPAELKALYERVGGWADELIVQAWIGGGVSDLYSCNCYFSASGELLATFVAKKLRQWPPDTGQSSLGVECRNDIVLAETVKLFESVGYRGLGYLEMKYDPDRDEHFIVEPNVGRPTGRSAIAEAGGVDLLYTMYCDAAGLPLPESRVQRYGTVKWIHLRRDLQSAIVTWRRGDLRLTDWIRSMRGRKAYAVASWRDPLPFLFDLFEAMRAAVKR